MLQLIEHIPDPGRFLQSARQLLKKGGSLYIATPNIESASFNYLASHHMHVSSFSHVALFGKESFIALAEKNGFDLLAHEFYGGLDLQLHDFATFAISKKKFKHRICFYNARLYYLCNFIDNFTFGLLRKTFTPKGQQSYQRMVFRAREDRE